METCISRSGTTKPVNRAGGCTGTTTAWSRGQARPSPVLQMLRVRHRRSNWALHLLDMRSTQTRAVLGVGALGGLATRSPHQERRSTARAMLNVQQSMFETMPEALPGRSETVPASDTAVDFGDVRLQRWGLADIPYRVLTMRRAAKRRESGTTPFLTAAARRLILPKQPKTWLCTAQCAAEPGTARNAPDGSRTRDLRLERPTLFGPPKGPVDH